MAGNESLSNHFIPGHLPTYSATGSCPYYAIPESLTRLGRPMLKLASRSLFFGGGRGRASDIRNLVLSGRFLPIAYPSFCEIEAGFLFTVQLV